MMRSRSRQTRAVTTPRPRSARQGAERALWLGLVALAAGVAAVAYIRDQPPRAARPSPPAARTSEAKTLRPAPSVPRRPLAPPPRADTEGAGEPAQPGTELGWRALGLEPLPADALPTGDDTGSVITPAEPGVAETKQDAVLAEDSPEAPPDSLEQMLIEPTIREPAPARNEARPSSPPPQRGQRGVDTGMVLTPAPEPEELE